MKKLAYIICAVSVAGFCYGQMGYAPTSSPARRRQMVVVGGAAPVDVGDPLAWWKMTATGTNATQILDFSDSGLYPASNRPSVASGPVLATDTTNYYYTFGGAQYFNADNEDAFDFGTNTAFSVSVWYDKVEAESAEVSVVTKQDTTGSPYEGFNVNCTATEEIFFQLVGNAGGLNYNKITTVANFSGWTHAVCVYRKGLDPASMEIWVNGVNQPVATNVSTLTSASFANTIPLQIGSRSGGSSLLFIGDIDDVRIFTNDLTQTQIENLFSEGRK